MNKNEKYHDKFIEDDFYGDENLLSELIEDNIKTFSQHEQYNQTGGKIIEKEFKVPTYNDILKSKKTKSTKLNKSNKQNKSSGGVVKDTKIKDINLNDENNKIDDEDIISQNNSDTKELSFYEKYKLEKMQSKQPIFDENGFKFVESQNTNSYILFKRYEQNKTSKDKSDSENKTSQNDEISSEDKQFEEDQIGSIDGKISTIGTNGFLKKVEKIYSSNDEIITDAKDILMETYNAGSKNIKLYQDTKSNLVSIHPNYKNEINYMTTSPIKNTSNTPFDKYIRFALTSNYLKKFIKPLVYKRKDLKLVIDSSECKNYINLIKLPKETIWLVNHIQLYFKQVKDQLKLNEDTGYYMMNIEIEKDNSKTNVEFPVMCKHLYMTYDDKSLDEISEECSRSGICKFCGDTLVSVGIDDTTQLPSSITDIIYRLIDLFDGDVSDQDYFLKIFNNFSKIVNKIVKLDDNNYEDRATAIASLYTFKIIQDAISEHFINSNDTNIIMKKILDNCAIIGWDLNKMNELVNKGIFQDTTDFIKVLKNDTKIKISGIDIDDVFKMNTEEIQNLKFENKLDLLRQLLNSEYYMDILLDSITMIKNSISKDNRLDFELTDFDKFNMFSKIIKTWCPVNIYHEYKNGICSHCEIKENLKNIEQIYKKFEKQFINDFDLKTENKFNITSKEEIINIDKIINECKDIQNYFMRRLNLSNQEYQDFLKAAPSIRRIILNSLEVIFNHTNKSLEDLTIEELLSIVAYADKNNMSDTLVPSLSLMNQTVDELISACDNYDYDEYDSDDE